MWEFTYDANGMRTRRTHSEIEYQYIYNGSQLTQLTVLETGGGALATNTLYFTYSADGTPLTVTSEGETYFYVTNIQGDVIAILDHAGRVVCRYIYDAWGNVTTDSWQTDIVSDHNPLRYRGYVYDQETQLYYLQSRYYNPEIGRFLNADAYVSTGQGVLGNNMFAYCGNNSVNRVDSTGYCYYTTGGVWTHDAWEYMGGYTRLPDPGYYAGTTNNGTSIYIASHTNYSVPHNNSMRILDQRDTNINPETGEHDPNIKIINSYDISDVAEQNQILDFVEKYVSSNPSVYTWTRSRKSLIKEWEIHNVVCEAGYAFDSTAHVDLNVDDEGKGYTDFLWDRVLKRQKRG